MRFQEPGRPRYQLAVCLDSLGQPATSLPAESLRSARNLEAEFTVTCTVYTGCWGSLSQVSQLVYGDVHGSLKKREPERSGELLGGVRKGGPAREQKEHMW